MSDFINSQLLLFLSFLKNPTDEAASKTSLASKLKIVLAFFLLEIPVMIVLILIISSLENAKIINTDNHAVETLFKTVPTAALFFLVVVLAPLFEELLFRLYLRYETNFAIRLRIAFACFFNKESTKEADLSLKGSWMRFYPKIFYFSAILFGLVHLVNFEISTTILFLAPVLVAPQIVLGLIIGYLRVRHGFITGFLMHAFHNMVFMGMSILALKAFPEVDKKEIKKNTSTNNHSEQIDSKITSQTVFFYQNEALRI